MRAFAALPAAIVLLTAACGDLPSVSSGPAALAPPEAFRAELRCTASIVQPGLSCEGGARPAGGALRTLIIGGQNAYVRLTAANGGYNPSDSIFQIDVTVQNLMTQVFGSPDGETDTGLRIFFQTAPIATVGTGNVELENEDGSDFFLSPDQPYFTDTGLRFTGEVSEGKTWRFKVDPDVQIFYFTVFVEGQLPHESSLLRFRPLHINEAAYVIGIWAADSANVFAVGTDGSLAHSAGGAWTQDESPTEEHLLDVWGSSASDVFAVGHAATIVHWDGTSWETMDSGLECACETLHGVWASGPSDVYAVGDFGVIVHFDGTQWVARDTLPVAWLSGVWGSSPTDVFVVGHSASIFHYDGTAWTQMTSGLEGSGQELGNVWGLSSTDVYAIASTRLLHYDGTGWSSLGSLSECEHHSVWGTSPTNLFVATVCGIEHFDGSTWASMHPGGFALKVWGTGALNVLTSSEGYVFRGTR